MGAWGESAFDNDAALDWLGEITSPIAVAIKGALVDYCTARELVLAQESMRRIRRRGDKQPKFTDPSVAEAAAHLLVDCTLNSTGQTHIAIWFEAEEYHLFDLAIRAVNLAVADEKYLMAWRAPEAKLNALLFLRASLIHAQSQDFHRRCGLMAIRRLRRKIKPKPLRSSPKPKRKKRK